MLLRLEVGKDGSDLSLRIDDERRPFDPHVFSAVHAFFFEHAKALGDGLVHVREQGEGQSIGVLEFLLRRRLIGRNAQQGGPGLVDFLVCVTEPGRLLRSTRGVGLGIKEQNERLSAIIC